MSSFIQQLLERCRFPDEDHLVCAVSGGADSLALLALACETGKAVTAVHVDHGLRSGSNAEAQLVERAAERLGAQFIAESVHVEPGPNLEARARAARYAVLPSAVLTGHTADDQAETVLLNIMRGASLDGLGGMRVDGHPILELRRAETHALCEALELRVFKDPTNDDMSILRNRVRRELIPLMNDLAKRDVAAVIAAQTSSLQAAAAALDFYAAQVEPLDAKALAALPDAVASRVVREWLREHLDDEKHPPDAKAVGRVLDVARGNARSCDVANGWRVVRSRQRLQLETVG